MSTYVLLQNRIAYETRTISTAAASGIETAIQNAILSAVAYYARERFYFNTKTNTFNTVAAQEYYSSSDLADIATLVEIFSLKVTLGTTKLDLTPVDFETMDSAQNGIITALPTNFAYFKQNIRLYPIPDAVYTMTMAYHYKLTALSAGSDSNAWTTDAEELIRNRAKADLYVNLLQDDNRAAACKAQEMDAKAILKRETRLRRSNNILRVDPALVAEGGYDIRYQ